jgi:hypothetical protein
MIKDSVSMINTKKCGKITPKWEVEQKWEAIE